MDDKITNPGAPLPGPATSGRDGSPSSLGLSRPDITPDKIAETVARLRRVSMDIGIPSTTKIDSARVREVADILQALAADNAAMAADIATLRECAKAEMERAEKAEQERDRIDQWRETAIVERDTYSEERDAAEAERDRLAAELAEVDAALARIGGRG